MLDIIQHPEKGSFEDRQDELSTVCPDPVDLGRRPRSARKRRSRSSRTRTSRWASLHYMRAETSFERAARQYQRYEDRVMSGARLAVKWLNRAKLAGKLAASGDPGRRSDRRGDDVGGLRARAGRRPAGFRGRVRSALVDRLRRAREDGGDRGCDGVLRRPHPGGVQGGADGPRGREVGRRGARLERDEDHDRRHRGCRVVLLQRRGEPRPAEDRQRQGEHAAGPERPRRSRPRRGVDRVPDGRRGCRACTWPASTWRAGRRRAKGSRGTRSRSTSRAGSRSSRAGSQHEEQSGGGIAGGGGGGTDPTGGKPPAPKKPAAVELAENAHTSPAAADALIAHYEGRWEDAIHALKKGTGDLSQMSPEARGKVIDTLLQHRQGFLNEIGKKFGAEPKGEPTASGEPESDVDLNMKGDEAGLKVAQATLFLDQAHPGWRTRFRMGLLVDAGRATSIGAHIAELPQHLQNEINRHHTRLERGCARRARGPPRSRGCARGDHQQDPRPEHARDGPRDGERHARGDRRHAHDAGSSTPTGRSRSSATPRRPTRRPG